MTHTNKLFFAAPLESSKSSVGRSLEEVRVMYAGDDDAQLVVASLKGDGDSFAALVDRHMSMVYKFVYRYFGNADAANDIVQDVFIKVWKNIKKFDQTKNFKTWLLTIAKNTALDAVKKKQSVLFSHIEEGEMDLDSFLAPYVESPDLPDELLQKKQIKSDLDHVLAELGPSYRSVLLLRNI